jgi:internalin A
LSELKQLETLVLSFCDGIPSLDGLSELKQLRTLDLSFCDGIPSLDGLSELKQLRTLDLNYCNRLPNLDSLGELKQLRTLNLNSSEALMNLDILSELKQLQELNLSGCEALTNLDVLSELKQLKTLNLSGCEALTNLDVLSELKQLQTLTLNGCEALPNLDILSELNQLKTLNLSGFEVLTSLDILSELKQLKMLNLRDWKAVTSLDALGGLKQLESLYLVGFEALTSLDILSELKQLKALYLRDCKAVTSLDALGGLKQLKTLDLSDCEALKNLDFLSELNQLENLYLISCEALTNLDALGDLKQLERLYLIHCEALTNLDALGGLKQLENLYLISCKKLTSVKDLSTLSNLNSCEITNCNVRFTFSKLEELLQQLPYLNTFHAQQLSIENTPSELTNPINNLDALEDWYHALQQGKVSLNNIKLQVMGNGRIGKTQLVRKLMGEPFDKSIASTHGIQVNQWPIDQHDPDSTQVSSWDFGGQDIYLSTHSLFLNDSAVYCLLWHPDFENTTTVYENDIPMQNKPLSYWLSYIYSLAGNKAPIIVAQSQCDSPLNDKVAPIPKSQPFNSLQTSSTSAISDDGLDLILPILKRSIKYQLDRNGEIFLPYSWNAVAKQLTQDKLSGLKTISQSHYLDYCQTNSVSAEASLLYYLHNSGQIFYKKGVFDDQVILDQTWALKGVYSLLERGSTLPALREAQGRFGRKMINELLWQKQGYSKEEQTLFLEMMQQCGVCFKICENYYIAPDSLPDEYYMQQEIASYWRNANVDVHIQLSYSFLHDGCLRSVLSSIGERAGKEALYWRYGCCYYDEKSQTSIKLSSKLHDSLTELELDDYGQPGSIELKLSGRSANMLGEHIVDSILNSHNLGRVPVVNWLKGKKKVNDEESEPKKISEAFSELNPATKLTKVYFSYAWGKIDDHHQQVCDAIYPALNPHVQVMRDREKLVTGDSIVEFEKEIGQANHIIIIFSEKSLQSEDCMRELEFIYRCCLHDKQHFRQRVIPIILGDVNIGNAINRAKYAKHWQTQFEELEGLVGGLNDTASTESVNLYRDIKNCITTVLTWANDVVLNRDQQALAEENYQTIVDLVLKKINKKKG